MKFYLSHPIAGKAGKKTTETEIATNCQIAIVIADYIRTHITPNIDIHVPAEMETFVHLAYLMDILTMEQILAVDCKIIESCDAVLIYAPFSIVVGGCKVEFDHALRCHKPVFVFEDAKTAVEMIAQFVLRS